VHLVVIIPAYNEAQVIGDVLSSLPKKITGIDKISPVVIDDNSRDDTKLMAEQQGALCVHHPVNIGAGGATITGLEAAKRLKADIVVTMDADAQHNPAEMTNLIQPIVAGRVDVVLGTRFKNERINMPFYKFVGNNMLNIVTFLFFRLWVSDSQSGYKAFSRRALHTIKLSTCGYEFCSEIIGEIQKNRLSFREVPISTIYTDYSKSKGQLTLNAINIILGLLLRSLRRTDVTH